MPPLNKSERRGGAQAHKWHPDRNRGNEDYASEQFKRAKAAHVKLGEP